MELEIQSKKPKFYLVQAGVQEFISNILEDDDAVTLGVLSVDGKDITYVKSINRPFINLHNIFQETMAQGQTKPTLQRVRGTVLTVNIAHVSNIAVVPKELQDRLNAAVVGLIV
jgi:hypothetical protein